MLLYSTYQYLYVVCTDAGCSLLVVCPYLVHLICGAGVCVHFYLFLNCGLLCLIQSSFVEVVEMIQNVSSVCELSIVIHCHILYLVQHKCHTV